jgi:hypothetical protein
VTANLAGAVDKPRSGGGETSPEIALLPGVQVGPPEPDVAADAVARRTLAAFTQAVQLVEAQSQEARRVPSGDQPQTILSWRGAGHDRLLELASLPTLPTCVVAVQQIPLGLVDTGAPTQDVGVFGVRL